MTLIKRRHKIRLPRKIFNTFAQQGKRHYCLYGGRGSGKSYSVALYILVQAIARPLRILCCREFQVSIKDSVLQQFIDVLSDHPWLEEYYEYGTNYLRGKNSSQFIFKGLNRSISEIKSTTGIDIVWCEEAETVSQRSLNILIPTIRASGSYLIFSWNPESIDSPVKIKFIDNPPDDAVVTKVIWQDNPWFPEVLEAERLACLKYNPDQYDWIWGGECLYRSSAQILNGKWVVDYFTPDSDTWDGPYFGADWGFGPHPTAAVKLWVFQNRLYVERESHEYQLPLREIAAQWITDLGREVKTYPTLADSSQPSTIRDVRAGRPLSPGLPLLQGAPKWQGSVEDGIQHLRNYYSIVVHPRCGNFMNECRRYSYKIDPKTDLVTREIIKEHDHLIDATRYALSHIIRRASGRKALTVSEVIYG